jgi:hypothetical protein
MARVDRHPIALASTADAVKAPAAQPLESRASDRKRSTIPPASP